MKNLCFVIVCLTFALPIQSQLKKMNPTTVPVAKKIPHQLEKHGDIGYRLVILLYSCAHFRE